MLYFVSYISFRTAGLFNFIFHELCAMLLRNIIFGIVEVRGLLPIYHLFKLKLNTVDFLLVK